MTNGELDTRGLRVAKYQALGNSYLILDPRNVDERTGNLAFDNCGFPQRDLVTTLCDLGRGIGSNGLLFGPVAGPPRENVYRLRIINSDGTLAGFSGNGTRIFAKYLLENGDVQPGSSIWLDIDEGYPSSRSGFVHARVLDADSARIEITAPQSPLFGEQSVPVASPNRLETGSASFSLAYRIPPLADIGAKATRSLDAWETSVLLDIGNPHCVTLVKRLEQLPSLETLRAYSGQLAKIANRGEKIDSFFERGCNLQWVYVENSTRIRLMVFERGEGATLASGSSAAAAACAAYRCGLVENCIEVQMPGGSLDVRLEGSADNIDRVTLSGFATRVFSGEFDMRYVISNRGVLQVPQ